MNNNQQREINPLSTISAKHLQELQLPPVRYIVNEMLPQGLALLVSPPKYGKSWFCLDLCLSVADGRSFLGHSTNQCGCLYLALEDSFSRLQDRMNKILRGKRAPENFFYAIGSNDLDNGLLLQLERHMIEHPDTGLIVIDTFQKVRGVNRPKENAYQADYKEMGWFKTFADHFHVCILLVHHLRKTSDDGDAFNRISGSNGILGAADTAIILTKSKRFDEETTLSITGRDVDSGESVLKFDKADYRWKVMGTAEAVAELKVKLDYQTSPVAGAIRRLMCESDGKPIRLLPKDFMEEVKKESHYCYHKSAKALGNDVLELADALFRYDRIVCERPKNGSGGRPYCFFRQGDDWLDVPDEREDLSEEDEYFEEIC